jgi:hypothetical protein
MTSAALPWMKFAPDRWQRDEAVRMCGAAARGVWLELICIMHKAEPYGHLLVRGKQPTDRQLSVITGLTILEIAQGLTELEENEVFSRTAEGVIFSRGMVRDMELHEEMSRRGSKGAKSRYQKSNGKKASHSSGNSSSNGTCHNLESESEEESEKTLPSIPPKLGGPKTEIPDGWEPEPFDPAAEPAAHRIESGWSPERRQSEIDSFRLNHRTKRSRYSDWQAIWGGWVRNAEKYDNRDQRESDGRKPAAPMSHADIVLAEIEAERRLKKRAGAIV